MHQCQQQLTQLWQLFVEWQVAEQTDANTEQVCLWVSGCDRLGVPQNFYHCSGECAYKLHLW